MHKKLDWLQNWLLMKNLQFWSNFDETLSNVPKNEVVNWTKFGQDWTKIVDFSLIANFEASLIFMHQSKVSSIFSFTIYLHEVLFKVYTNCNIFFCRLGIIGNTWLTKHTWNKMFFMRTWKIDCSRLPMFHGILLKVIQKFWKSLSNFLETLVIYCHLLRCCLFHYPFIYQKIFKHSTYLKWSFKPSS